MATSSPVVRQERSSILTRDRGVVLVMMLGQRTMQMFHLNHHCSLKAVGIAAQRDCNCCHVDGLQSCQNGKRCLWETPPCCYGSHIMLISQHMSKSTYATGGTSRCRSIVHNGIEKTGELFRNRYRVMRM
jgi:hypothetical protein